MHLFLKKMRFIWCEGQSSESCRIVSLFSVSSFEDLESFEDQNRT